MQIYKQMTDKLNRLKSVLAENNRTGLWLSEQLGVNISTVSRWCTNTSQPDLHTLHKIAELLNIDQRELLVPTLPKQQK